ncbi:hypothetical protein PHMEG_0008160 [Phytophthora megakarya]|uniref:Uncharacterized protein n=1 Tax=Phytophthora megakarya TaxID=4795 RepID=A0A225WLV6_9STRA|nr:hypothetical protein PHMEG_0008160 [Phytophthora megakarya]
MMGMPFFSINLCGGIPLRFTACSISRSKKSPFTSSSTESVDRYSRASSGKRSETAALILWTTALVVVKMIRLAKYSSVPISGLFTSTYMMSINLVIPLGIAPGTISSSSSGSLTGLGITISTGSFMYSPPRTGRPSCLPSPT